tara:strand:+ start:184 stop:1101 length:918 start_codon:yes stop_codon:yes gene_type:complete
MSKIIFLGTPKFAIPILRQLIKSKKEIFAVFTQPPNKSNRGQKIIKSPIQKFAEENNLNVKSPTQITKEKKFLVNSKIDLGIVVAYGQLIPSEILKASKHGFINIHASLLPKYRGAAPIQRSIINLDQVTGISFMKITEKLDSGPVCNKYELNIDKNDNYVSLSDKLSLLGADKIIENIELILSNNATFIEQEHRDATYARKIDKSEGKINWKEDAATICAKVNGLYPNPGAWFEFNSERFKILKSDISSLQGEPGMVLDEKLTIACGKDSILVNEIQRQGKTAQNIKNFLLGNKIQKGVNLNDE